MAKKEIKKWVETHERKWKYHADPVSWFGLLSFFGIWVGSPVIPVACIGSALAKYSNKPLMGLVAYYSYAYFFPAKPSKFVLWLYGACLQRCYFKKQTVVVLGEEVKRDDKTLCCFHPHGALSCGWTLANASRSLGSLTTNMRWLVAPLLFKIPLINEVLRWNSVQSVTPQNFKRVMALGENISIIPGGFHSAALFQRNKFRCFVMKRKGFVKYALQFGYKLRPCFSFGEEKTYYTLNAFEKLRMKLLANNNMPPVIFLGKYGVLPCDDFELTCIVGEPIQCPKIEKPTAADVDKYHALYIEGLRKVFDDHKAEYAHTDAVLELE
ncbi:hypothetical protein TrST_g6649 [Triparma strigata]|uniref:Acyltransferase n=1 Tax=Triparma strigata TaxID=1606541 RepID=A0A9W7ATA9_9STRA|nr:hypothetical protein TrST_g6649 [Triparma strigata]